MGLESGLFARFGLRSWIGCEEEVCIFVVAMLMGFL